MLPRVVEALIMDYYWSAIIYDHKQRIHRELKHLHAMAEMRVFFDIWSTITIPISNIH
jgi:hypothetical protein